MLILADARLPERVLKNLGRYGQVVPFASQGVVYEAISGHPDIFLCQVPGGVVAAPNTPKNILEALENKGTSLFFGKEPLGKAYPATARYNAFSGKDCLLHLFDLTDEVILAQTQGLEKIAVRQGYARCSLVEAGRLYITSDRGIEKELKQNCRETFYVDPSPIILPGQPHGFFGGCTGVWGQQLFLAGSLRHFPEGELLQQALVQRGITIIELYDGPLWDGGSILFL
ncbi:MAG: hypothetical protein V2I46_12005 [Bacteroides sp.]|jgi:hypothetical protein|nr:hypothetical protein [Bacteroides sp.]